MAIENVFNSSSAIRDTNQRLLVGREEALSKAYLDVNKIGAILAVYGERGVGKSSFVWQLLNILNGKKETVDLFNLNISLSQPRKCLYIECSSKLENLPGLLRKLIFRETIDNTSMSELSLLEIFKEVNLQKNIASDIPDQITDDQVIDLYFKITRHIVRETNQEIIICIDEFERLPSKKDFGDFFKLLQATKEDSGVKYIISGVAKSHRELITDHASLPRKLKPVILDRLNRSMVYRFFEIAQEILNGAKIHFDESFIDKAYSFSNGFPPIMQLIGESFVDFLVLRKIPISDDITNILTGDLFDKFYLEIAESEEIKHLEDFSALRHSINKPGKVAIIKKFVESSEYYVDKKLLSDDVTKYGFIPNMQALIDSNIFEENELNNNLIKFSNPYFRFILKSEIASNKDISRGRVKTN